MKCAYSLDQGSSWIDLPVGPLFDLALGLEESNIDLETDGGARWIERLCQRDRWELTFKFTMTQLAEFRALHDAVDGSVTPFLFTLNRLALPIVAIYGRKEPGFLPVGTGDKVMPPVFTYRMTIRQEIPTLAAFGLTELWNSETAGFDSITSTPIVVADFHKAGVAQGPCVIYTSGDGSCYVRKIADATLVWSKAAGAACYGRAQAAILQGESNHSVFFGSNDGLIWAQNSDGTNRWQQSNLYKREGGYGTSGLTPVANAGGASFVQVSGKNWNVDAFVRSKTVPGGNASVHILSGLGAGATLYEVKEVDAADHSKLTFFSAIFPSVDGTSRIEVVPNLAADAYWRHSGTLTVEGGVDYLIACGNDGTVTKIRCTDGVVTAYACALGSNYAWPLVQDIGLGHVSVVYGSLDKKVRSLRLSDLALEWSHTFPQGVAATIVSAAVDGSILAIVVNGLRSGDPTAGRLTYLKASDGTLLYASGDLLGDMRTRPLPILQGDSTYKVFVVGEAGRPSILDPQAAIIWQKIRDTEFVSSPLGYDLDSDGELEIIACDLEANILIYNQNGVLFTVLQAYAGVEGTPEVGQFLANGKVQFLVPTITTGALKGRMTCYEFSQG